RARRRGGCPPPRRWCLAGPAPDGALTAALLALPPLPSISADKRYDTRDGRPGLWETKGEGMTARKPNEKRGRPRNNPPIDTAPAVDSNGARRHTFLSKGHVLYVPITVIEGPKGTGNS